MSENVMGLATKKNVDSTNTDAHADKSHSNVNNTMGYLPLNHDMTFELNSIQYK